MKKLGTRFGFWFVRRNPRLAARWGWKAASNPGRTIRILGVARLAPSGVGHARSAAADPKVRRELHKGKAAAGKAASRLRSAGNVDVLADEKLWRDIRLAALAMSAAYAQAARPPKPRRRMRKIVFTVGLIGAGAYAGYRVTRGGEPEPAPVADAYDQAVEASFPSSDPPAAPIT